jgi:hypothetical protein
MSPELEVLDQLLGGDLPLSIIFGLFPDKSRFVTGLTGLLRDGNVRLIADCGRELPQWQWRDVLGAPGTWPTVRVTLTEAGARLIG